MKVDKIQKYTNNFYKGVYKPKKVNDLLNISTKKVGIIGLGTLIVLITLYKYLDNIQKLYQIKQSKRREEKLYEKYCGHKLSKLG